MLHLRCWALGAAMGCLMSGSALAASSGLADESLNMGDRKGQLWLSPDGSLQQGPDGHMYQAIFNRSVYIGG